MYRAEEEKSVIEDEEVTLYGIADENCFYCSFTLCKEVAEKVADMLNENKVADCHVNDIIEDLFYSG